MTERELVKGCIRENRNCQQEVFHRYAGKMLVVCQRYAPNRMEAEDVLQDAFIRVFDHIDQFEHKGSLEGWIRRIVVNTAIKHYKLKYHTHELNGLDLMEETYSMEPSIYAHLHEKELLNLISELPEGYRHVFNLYAIEGYSHHEIADMLDIKESTSRSQLVKARKMLQAKILDMQKIAV